MLRISFIKVLRFFLQHTLDNFSELMIGVVQKLNLLGEVAMHRSFYCAGADHYAKPPK